MSKKTILTFSNYKGNFFGHGGERRAKQIREVLSAAFVTEHVPSQFKFNNNQLAPLATRLKRSSNVRHVLSATNIYKHNFSLSKLLDESHKFFIQGLNLAAVGNTINDAYAIVWENNFPDFFYLPYHLKKTYGKRIIACPQNIESLIPNQQARWYGKDKLDFLRQEIEPFGLCDDVFTISEEDQWLLNLLDVPAKFLPYYPQGDLFESLLAIRSKRKEKSNASFFLIVGSVGNPPTKAGMLKLLTQLKKISKNKNHRFVVGGFGTDIFQGEFSGANIEILGAIDEPRLNELMIDCRAMIISQGYSTGALTKIPEILVSGIPVIVDTGSARTYKRTDGVYVYDSLNNLEEYLNAELPMPEIPAVPSRHYEAFLNAMSHDDN